MDGPACKDDEVKPQRMLDGADEVQPTKHTEDGARHDFDWKELSDSMRRPVSVR